MQRAKQRKALECS